MDGAYHLVTTQARSVLVSCQLPWERNGVNPAGTGDRGTPQGS